MNAFTSEPFNSKLTSGKNKSFWIESEAPIIFEKLQQHIDTDVLIVGGGIAGLTTAYCLCKAGYKIALVEDGYIGSGESGRTTAHITCALDDRYYELENIFGAEKTRLAASSHTTAINWIRHVVSLENIDCNFKSVDGYLFLHESDKKENLQKEYSAAKKAGLIVNMLPQVPEISASEGKECIHFPEQAQFHILKYLRGLANAVIRLGGSIYTETKAEEINKNGCKANGFTISAKHIVVATNTPVNDLVTMHTKQWPYRTYVIAAKIAKGKKPYSLWWDTGNMNSKWISAPYHYVRLEPFNDEYDLLIAGGEDHKTGQADDEDIPEQDRYTKLTEWTKKRFPEMEEIVYQWSGQVMEPVDSMAFIGKNPGDDNVFIITGDSGNGMTHATIGGMLITDLIQNKKNDWEKLYDPSRITLSTSDDYLHEAGNMAAQYTDWISGGDVKEADALLAGQGGIISSGLKKYAVYRDAQNKLHVCTAVCPHLGGILKWNGDEQTFDCPVHGSRFTIEGKVINGPAVSDLKKLEMK